MYPGLLLKDELSGSIAKSYVSQISEFHRIQASTMYHDAALYVVGELKKLGLTEVQILKFPSDGKRKYWLYRTSPGWAVKRAELRLLAPKDELLANYADIPTSLHTFSEGTPSEGVTAELVDVGSGTSAGDYAGKKVKDRIVLATGGAHSVHIEAVVKRGAAGVITDTVAYGFPRVRQSIDVPDARSYQGIWPNSDNAEKIRFGFSVSKRQGDELRQYLEQGKKVRLRAKVDARLLPADLEVVTATIKGSSKREEEVFLSAHLCHPKPGANDNASGSGLLMEIARAIQSLITSKKLDRPARTIRFFWVPETIGTVALLSTHPEIRKRLIAGINLDMVGEDQTMCGSTLQVSTTPDSLPSYLNDLVSDMLSECARELDPYVKIGLTSKFRYICAPFSPGSDHSEFVESGVGVPCVSLTQWPDRFYHTSEDTIDKVSEDSLRRVGWATAATILTVADADARTGHEMAILAYSRGAGRITEAFHKSSRDMFRMIEEPMVEEKGQELVRLSRYHKDRIEHIVIREQRAVGSVLALTAGKELEKLVNMLAESLSSIGGMTLDAVDRTVLTVARSLGCKTLGAPRDTKAERRSKSLVPSKKFKGTLPWGDLQDLLTERQRSAYKKIDAEDIDFSSKIAETVNLIDGKRTVNEIVLTLCAEYGPTEPESILTLLRDLEGLKLVSIRSVPRNRHR